jgi:hypothetical protein
MHNWGICDCDKYLIYVDFYFKNNLEQEEPHGTAASDD